MKKKTTLCLLYFIIALSVAFGCGMHQRPKREILSIPGGTVIPTLGVGFDVQYDSTLENVIPGYKLLTVAYTNNSMNLIQLNPAADVWYVVDRRGKKIKAIINLRQKDPDVWSPLQKKLKILIEYPLLISIGGTQTIDLIFKDSVNLGEFRMVVFKPAGENKEYRIVPREE